jgi:hypothetical protein
MPPAELIDLIIDDTAYWFELRGRRWTQARENLKKLRAILRRIQNRGYATMARIAEHVDRLSAGDEANAVLDAVDAVNLMTVHAAKGLEFPVVFLVNLARGTGGPPKPIRIADDPRGPSVGIGSFQTSADEDERRRGLEETRRLLYVAVTRGRERLYLSTLLREGVFRPARGSLGEVLPESIRTALGAAATATSSVIWSGAFGPHELHVPQPAEIFPGPELRFTATRKEDFAVVACHATERIIVSSAEDDDTVEVATRVDPLAAWEWPSDIQALTAGRTVVRGVAFSSRCNGAAGPAIVRGVIDLAAIDDQEVDVVVLKAGPPHPDHQTELDASVSAAGGFWPRRRVQGRLIYL